MRRIAHISDLHFGRHDPTVAEGLLTALQESRPDLVAVSGDLTQRARSHEFAAARQFLDRLAVPALVVPGNHDIPLYNLFDRLFRPLSRYSRLITRDRQLVIIDEKIAVLGINTARGWIGPNGRISTRHVAEIRTGFSDVGPSVLRILVTHHPLLVPWTSHRLPAVRGARHGIEAIATAGVQMLLSGHYHRQHSAEVGIEYVAAKRSVLIVHAGTAISTRLREGANSFNLICIADGKVDCTPYVWDGARFQPTSPKRFAISDSRWRPLTADVAAAG